MAGMLHQRVGCCSDEKYCWVLFASYYAVSKDSKYTTSTTYCNNGACVIDMLPISHCEFEGCPWYVLDRLSLTVNGGNWPEKCISHVDKHVNRLYRRLLVYIKKAKLEHVSAGVCMLVLAYHLLSPI